MLLVAGLVSGAGSIAASQTPAAELAQRVEIRRTAYGVPHIRARDLEAAGYALAWVQLEDHGPKVAIGLLRGRGEMARFFGHDSIDGDFLAKRQYDLAVQHYAQLDADTRAIYEGFATGANRYIELHPTEFPEGFAPHFTGYDIAARDVMTASAAEARKFLQKIGVATPRGAMPAQQAPSEGWDPREEGSNAWAFAPSRTKSGKAILLRNPHLAWSAGYYEAQMTVPGVMDFYGDFRIGGPFGVIGGFNRDLGWSTTNNAPDLEEVYALDVDPAQADHYLFDGTSLPLERELVTVAFRNGAGVSTETRESWRTPLGPVIHRANGRIYVLKAAGEGDFRGGEQFLRMMRAHSLEEWKDAMRMRARVTSNFTYADRAGNIFYVWNASIPALPHPSGGDTAAVPAHRTADVWTQYVPFDSLPQLLNPRGGYVENENDPPYFTNLRQLLDRTKYPANFPEPTLSFRTQHALSLVDPQRKLSLEDVIALKHSYRMTVAERVKDELLAAVLRSNPDSATRAAAEGLAKWDNTAAPQSRGGVLFAEWWNRYTSSYRGDSVWAQQWSPSAPTTTPRGLANHTRAVWAFGEAAKAVTRRWGSWNVAWGDVHRVRLGDVDVPVGGCSGFLGCFRVLNFRDDPDGKRAAVGGDGWVLAVEFGNVPRAYSVLAYGESPRPNSPHSTDQAAMFARGEMKKVLFTEAEVEAGTVTRYRPGAQ